MQNTADRPDLGVLTRLLADRNASKEQYERKLAQLTTLLDSLLTMQQRVGDAGGAMALDGNALEQMLAEPLEVIEKDGQQYALVPLCGAGAGAAEPPKQRRKRTQLTCSYCHEVGHTRARCERRLLGRDAD
ncbi:AFR181Wp [Eremothecium gossypii ATCC 10895]|uniref:AFR181Wp n=1 Tax=Eremothecium gossypii (strain ATCC 10895 / CBS 109.51 / FGSC 9923 / NRRL Y-1056) TaxID=284811 RepID=Q753Z1_EREGS|nr:AFR181Wp [Eremothecium gossypii ATCC 10895]AAS53552.1 AFR181Wp [Eremothecium gossypii ATCC 10895]AEY97865.1 FAFR181Wp [Eremothecium gossypii FDAG1]